MLVRSVVGIEALVAVVAFIFWIINKNLGDRAVKWLDALHPAWLILAMAVVFVHLLVNASHRMYAKGEQRVDELQQRLDRFSIDAPKRIGLLQVISHALTSGRLISDRVTKHMGIASSPNSIERCEEMVEEWVARIYGNLQQHSANYAESFGKMPDSEKRISISFLVSLKGIVDQKVIILESLRGRLDHDFKSS